LLIVLTSEQPLCGGFNNAVIDRAVAAHRELAGAGRVEVVAVGQRGNRALTARGLTPDQVERGATSLAGLRDVVRRLSNRADHGYATGAIAAVHVVFARYRSVSEQDPTFERVLPLDLSLLSRVSLRSPVCRYLPDAQLVSGLISQFAFIAFYHAAAESYASEQASRLVAMDGATRNTSRMVDDLASLERRERQHEITRQMLELAASRLTRDNAREQESRPAQQDLSP
jgi:F-type H+-transporting ATPase subunit gamma